jgi:hypothetical protein
MFVGFDFGFEMTTCYADGDWMKENDVESRREGRDKYEL